MNTYRLVLRVGENGLNYHLTVKHVRAEDHQDAVRKSGILHAGVLLSSEEVAA